MASPAAVRKRYQRFFAWTFVLMGLLAFGMCWLEAASPPSPLPLAAPVSAGASAAGGDGLALEMPDLQLLITITAVVAALASLAGLVVTTPLVWLANRRARARALEAALRRQGAVRGAARRHRAAQSSARRPIAGISSP
ncbi:MAG: hypothetical protein EOP82_31180 [Variovorax sp.]|nr:MAG: hypothetical protein EOP82_31180 [Variovorax sp.]